MQALHDEMKNVKGLWAIHRPQSPLFFGDLGYLFGFTGLDDSIYKAQITDLSKYLGHPETVLSNTYEATPISKHQTFMGYSIKTPMAKGGTSLVASATRIEGGFPYVIKQIIRNHANLEAVKREIKTLKEMNHVSKVLCHIPATSPLRFPDERYEFPSCCTTVIG